MILLSSVLPLMSHWDPLSTSQCPYCEMRRRSNLSLLHSSLADSSSYLSPSMIQGFSMEVIHWRPPGKYIMAQNSSLPLSLSLFSSGYHNTNHQYTQLSPLSSISIIQDQSQYQSTTSNIFPLPPAARKTATPRQFNCSPGLTSDSGS